jgi:hypothetical protein
MKVPDPRIALREHPTHDQLRVPLKRLLRLVHPGLR